MSHIVIDVRHIRDFGIGTYIRNLIQALARLDRHNRYTLVTLPGEVIYADLFGPNFICVSYSLPEDKFVHNLTFPSFLKTLNADLYHIPLNLVPWLMPRPYVLTVHDMSSILFPARPDFRHTWREERYRRGALRATRLITVSHSTQRDIETVLRIPAEKIRTIYSAPDPVFTATAYDPTKEQQILERYSINYPYILYAGTIRPQKNIPRLIEAFAVLRSELENHKEYKDLHLVIIGDEVSKNSSVRRAIAQARMESAVRFLGFVPAETLRLFYRLAAVFAFPSLYEGFGLAPLEAMACGAPVVASDIPSLVEATGDAAELVSPDNVFDIARGLRAVLLDRERRLNLIHRGTIQAGRFNWDRTASEVLNIYQEITENSSNKY